MAASSTAILKALAASRNTGTANLSGKGLTELPSALYNLDEPLPATHATESKWWEISELTKVDLSRNSLAKLPEQLGLLTSITHLDICNNVLPSLFTSITNLQSLKLLNCDVNKLQALPPCVAQLRSLVVLSAASNSLQHLPDQLGYKQPMLASVDLHANAIETLPPGLGYSSSLTKLDVSNNRLRALPPHLMQPGGLSVSLAELNLSGNALKDMPYELGMLSKLRVLNLKENQLASLPQSIGYCTSLVELHLGFNSLTALPDGLEGCQQLKTLDVRNNKMQELCVGLCKLKLTLLDLTNNDLRNLPPQLGLMTCLRSMPLDGNPLRLIRRELVAGPMSALLKFLESRIPEDEASGGGSTQGGLRAQHAARSGNVWGVDEAALAAEAAKKLSVAAAAAEAAEAAGTAVPLPSRWGVAGGYARGGSGGSSGGGYRLNAPGPGYGPAAGGGYGQGAGPQYAQAHDSSYATGAGSGYGPAAGGGYGPGAGAGYGPAAGGYGPGAGPGAGYGQAAGGGYGPGGAGPGYAAGLQGQAPPQASGLQARMQERELNFARAGLREVPPEVWQAGEWLTKLDLTGNPLGTLPSPALAACTRLRSLGLASASLQLWPLPLQHQGMPCLQELLLSGNRELRNIPRHAFVTCPSLVTLDLAGVPGAGGLPPGSLLPLTRLQTLDMTQTGCVQFPVDTLSLPSLRVLKLGNNRLTQIPDQIGQCCTRLEELDVSNNDLQSVTPYLSLLSGSLRNLMLDGNPLRTMRRAILDRGTPAVLAYLHDRMPA